MAKEIRVPVLGESITEATIGQVFKKVGDTVAADEPLVELETEKVTVEVPAPATGVIEELLFKTGDTVPVGALLGMINESTEVRVKPTAKAEAPKAAAKASAPAAAAPVAAPAAKPAPARQPAPAAAGDTLAPSVRKLVAEHNLQPEAIAGTGKDGRITKGDALAAVAAKAAPAERPVPSLVPVSDIPTAPDQSPLEQRVRMTRLRQTIARRLKEAQDVAAMLTTFNEVDMSGVIGLRNQYKDLFEKKHGVKLGFMSFFVKAAIQALKEVPAVNAEIDGEDIVYKNYYHIGVAVGTERGLVVPVIRDADKMTLAEIETAIAGLGKRARDGQLGIPDMQGGTFTISNGGVYGSLLSTPILNAPQSGILGMHKIEQRPVVVEGRIEARPMMYLALTYDHRIVDGREAVTFLVRVKESLEDPQRLVLDL